MAQQVWPSSCGPAGVDQQVLPSKCGSAGVAQQVWPSRCGPADVAQQVKRPTGNLFLFPGVTLRLSINATADFNFARASFRSVVCPNNGVVLLT